MLAGEILCRRIPKKKLEEPKKIKNNNQYKNALEHTRSFPMLETLGCPKAKTYHPILKMLCKSLLACSKMLIMVLVQLVRSFLKTGSGPTSRRRARAAFPLRKTFTLLISKLVEDPRTSSWNWFEWALQASCGNDIAKETLPTKHRRRDAAEERSMERPRQDKAITTCCRTDTAKETLPKWCRRRDVAEEVFSHVASKDRATINSTQVWSTNNQSF
jgi:hypothetical protein